MLPFEYFKAYCTIIMSEIYDQLKLREEWRSSGRVITPRAEKKIQHQINKASSYSVNFSSDERAFVSPTHSPLQQRRVELNSPNCSCSVWHQFQIPCRHIIAVLLAKGRSDRIMSIVNGCYTVATYGNNTTPINLPEDTALTVDVSILPSKHIVQAGRPRKRRIRSRGETSSSSRTRATYKCSNCRNRDGHNKATCR